MAVKIEPHQGQLVGKRKYDGSEISAKRQKVSRDHNLSDGSLKVLHFNLNGSFELSDEIFSKSVESISGLKELCWHHGFNQVTDLGLEKLKDKVQNLTRLELHSAGTTTARSIGSLVTRATNLQILNLSGCSEVNDLLAKTWINHPHLAVLKLKDCDNLTDPAIEQILTCCPNLKVLDLEGCEKCTDQTLVQLAQKTHGILDSLERLFVGCCPLISDQGVEIVASKASYLKEVNLRMCRQVTGGSIPILASLNHLEVLDLSDSSVNDQAFDSLNDSSFSSLQELNLANTSVTNQTVKKLAKISLNLHTLILNGCEGINWECLEILPLFPQLKKLEIASINLQRSAGVLHPLKHCAQLEVLNINHLKSSEVTSIIASDVIMTIKDMPQLKTVQAVGIQGAEEFKKVISNNLHPMT